MKSSNGNTTSNSTANDTESIRLHFDVCNISSWNASFVPEFPIDNETYFDIMKRSKTYVETPFTCPHLGSNWILGLMIFFFVYISIEMLIFGMFFVMK